MRSETKSTPNAFSRSFLHHVPALGESALASPVSLTGGAYWAGPWDVQPVEVEHGTLWAVVRSGDRLDSHAGTVAVFRERSTALLVAAVLPALALPNHLHVGEAVHRLGVPIHDGETCLGHLARAEPRLLEALHAARTLALQPHSLALLVEALGKEELPTFGRLLLRRVEAIAADTA